MKEEEVESEVIVCVCTSVCMHAFSLHARVCVFFLPCLVCHLGFSCQAIHFRSVQQPKQASGTKKTRRSCLILAFLA